MPGDREPEAGTAAFAAACRVDPVEALEDAGQMLGRNALSLIGNGDRARAFRRFDTDADSPALRRMADRVTQEIRQHGTDRSGATQCDQFLARAADIGEHQ